MWVTAAGPPHARLAAFAAQKQSNARLMSTLVTALSCMPTSRLRWQQHSHSRPGCWPLASRSSWGAQSQSRCLRWVQSPLWVCFCCPSACSDPCRGHGSALQPMCIASSRQISRLHAPVNSQLMPQDVARVVAAQVEVAARQPGAISTGWRLSARWSQEPRACAASC